MAVDPIDVAVELGMAAPSAIQQQQFLSWINQARLILRIGDGSHAGLGSLDAVDQDVLDYVVLQSVVAHARHPGSEVQVSTSVDDASVSRTYQRGQGRVVIADELWAMLVPTVSGAFTVSPYGAPDVGGRDAR